MLTADHHAGAFNGGVKFDTTQALSAMRQLIIKQLDYDLTPVAGLTLIGQYLKALRPHLSGLDAARPIIGGLPTAM